MSPSGALPITQYRRFESFREYEALIDAMVPQTEMFVRVFDKILPPAWNGLQRTELLRQFLRRNPANRLYVILHDTGNIARNLPRMAELLRDFSHACKIRQTPKMAHHLYDPFVTFDASHYLHRFHYAHMRAAIGTHDVEGTRQLLERHAELWEASAPASVSATGGL